MRGFILTVGSLVLWLWPHLLAGAPQNESAPSETVAATIDQVKTVVLERLVSKGWQIEADTAYQLAFSKEENGGRGIMAQLLAGNSRCPMPRSLIRVILAQRADAVFVMATQSVRTQSGFACVPNEISLDGKKQRAGIKLFLAEIKTRAEMQSGIEKRQANGTILPLPAPPIAESELVPFPATPPAAPLRVPLANSAAAGPVVQPIAKMDIAVVLRTTENADKRCNPQTIASVLNDTVAYVASKGLSLGTVANSRTVLVLIVDRPVSKWIEITLQGQDSSGNVLWNEKVSDGGWGHLGEQGLLNTLDKVHRIVDARLPKQELP